MTTTEELNAALATLEAQVQQDNDAFRELQQAAEDCDPRAQFPVSTADIEALETPFKPRPAPQRRATPMLWASLRG